MAKHIQIRDVDEETYSTLRRRAAAENLSLSAYLKRMLEKEASGPTMAEWVAGATDRDWAVDRETIVRIQREIRDEHDE
jgi:plasmid stability protein